MRAVRGHVILLSALGLGACGATPPAPPVSAVAPSPVAIAPTSGPVAPTPAQLSASPASASPVPAATVTPWTGPVGARRTGPMGASRANPGSAQLPDGRILVVGGVDITGRSYNYLASAEIYDPGTGRFAETGPMAAARAAPSVVPLADGRVLVACGYSGDARGQTTSVVGDAEVYDPAAGSFASAGPMLHWNDCLGAARLHRPAASRTESGQDGARPN